MSGLELPQVTTLQCRTVLPTSQLGNLFKAIDCLKDNLYVTQPYCQLNFQVLFLSAKQRIPSLFLVLHPICCVKVLTVKQIWPLLFLP